MEKVKTGAVQYIKIIIGIMMTAFAISVFYVPNKIVNGVYNILRVTADCGKWFSRV